MICDKFQQWLVEKKLSDEKMLITLANKFVLTLDLLKTLRHEEIESIAEQGLDTPIKKSRFKRLIEELKTQKVESILDPAAAPSLNERQVIANEGIMEDDLDDIDKLKCTEIEATTEVLRQQYKDEECSVNVINDMIFEFESEGIATNRKYLKVINLLQKSKEWHQNRARRLLLLIRQRRDRGEEIDFDCLPAIQVVRVAKFKGKGRKVDFALDTSSKKIQQDELNLQRIKAFEKNEAELAQKRSEVLDSSKWTCSCCSCANSTSVSKCGVCFNSRPYPYFLTSIYEGNNQKYAFEKNEAELARKRSKVLDSSKWTCNCCFYVNSTSVSKCRLCFSLRPYSYNSTSSYEGNNHINGTSKRNQRPSSPVRNSHRDSNSNHSMESSSNSRLISDTDNSMKQLIFGTQTLYRDAASQKDKKVSSSFSGPEKVPLSTSLKNSSSKSINSKHSSRRRWYSF